MPLRLLIVLLYALCPIVCAGEEPAPKPLFIAIGGEDGTAADGHRIESEFGLIHTSEDGETWTRRFRGGPVTENFSHANNNMLRCLTYGNGMFVATGNPKCVVTSTDGIAWNVVNAPSGSMSVAFGNGMFVAPNAYGFMTSTDGRNWTVNRPKVDFPIWGKSGAGHVRKTVFGNGVFVCVGDQRVGVTTDGKTWKHHRILKPEERPGRNVLLFGNGRFVWLCEKTPSLVCTDGIEWQPIDFSAHDGNGTFGNSAVFDGKRFLASAAVWNEKSKVIYESTDGISWKAATETNELPSFTTVGNGILLANVGHAKSFRLSKDEGKTWNEFRVNIPSRKVYYFDGMQVVGQNGG